MAVSQFRIVILALGLLGCSKKEAAPPSTGSAEGTPAAGAPAGAGMVEIPLTKYGMTMQVPRVGLGSETAVEHDEELNIDSSPALYVSLGESTPEKLVADRDAINLPTTDVKTETLADGFVTSALGNNKIYYVDAFRKINGKSIHCRSTGFSPKDVELALASCKSIK